MKQSSLIFKSLAVSFFIASSLFSREIRTPLLLQNGPVNRLFFELQRNDWCTFAWAAGYFKHATKAYNSCGNSVNYAFLYFAKNQFNAQDAFPNSSAQSPTNPLLASSILGPRVTYKEQGAALGATAQRWINDSWRYGARASLPIRSIKVRRLRSCGNGTGPLGGQTIADVTQEKVEVVNGSTVQSFAYRLDFLSQLPYACTCLGLDFLIVNYRDPDFPFDTPVTISNQDTSQENFNPVTVIKSDSGTIPQGPFAITQQAASAIPNLDSLANNIPDGGRGRFNSNVNYIPLQNDPAAQATLFVVPTVAGTQVVAPARVIKEHVDELLECVAPSAEQVFADCGISFDNTCIRGAGDFDTEVFVGHYFNDCLYAEGFFGIRWPTGRRIKDPRVVFAQPLGNNGHYEYKLGLQSLWQPTSYALLKGDLAVSIVQKGRERVAASFQGATVKNIGACVPARIHWNYLTIHTDLIITPCSFAGIDIGYELYHKSTDKISFCQKSAVDCLNNTAFLSASPLNFATEATSHKIRAEFFANLCFRGYAGEFFLGGSVVFAGKNVPKDKDFECGLAFYF